MGIIEEDIAKQQQEVSLEAPQYVVGVDVSCYLVHLHKDIDNVSVINNINIHE
jgi:hypothetical protein